MITRTKIATTTTPLFEECWALYTEAFPAEERRTKEYQAETLTKREYRFEAILVGATMIGIIGWWDLRGIRFIEHLAVAATARGGGYGKKILDQFISEDSRPILLEVEKPEDDIKRRRIGFYERLCFHLNLHPYSQPPFIGDKPVELLVMTHPSPISLEELEKFKTENFPIIHFKNTIK